MDKDEVWVQINNRLGTDEAEKYAYYMSPGFDMRKGQAFSNSLNDKDRDRLQDTFFDPFYLNEYKFLQGLPHIIDFILAGDAR